VFNGNSAQVTGALLPASVPNITIDNIAGVKLSNSSLTVTGTMTINSGKLFTLEVGKQLTVSGLLTNSAGTSGLVIKSDANGTGSLITTNGVNATVERFITKYNGTLDKMYHFISSPVSDQAIFTDLSDFYRFSELNNYWISRTGNGVPEAFGDASFVVGRGYMVANSADITKTFSGTLNTYPSATPLTITCTKTTGKGEGWNLLGNPFSSAIDWDLVKTRNSGVDNALYYYDAAQQNYRYYIQLGSIGTLGSGSRYIPAMQGFMVHANTNNGTVTINNDDRVHQALTTYYKQGGSPSNLLILKVEANGFEDETNLFFTDLANTAFDSEYDAYKIFSANENVPQLYSITSDGTKLAINSMPENISGTSVVLGIKTGSETASTLTASSIDSFESGTEITLIDNKTNNIQNLTKNPVYNFTSTQGDDPARFELKFGTVGINDPIVNPLINAWYNAGKLYLVNDAGNTNIEVYNLQGQKVQKLFVQDGGLQTISLNLPAGVYFAQIISNGINQTVKIIIP